MYFLISGPISAARAPPAALATGTATPRLDSLYSTRTILTPLRAASHLLSASDTLVGSRPWPAAERGLRLPVQNLKKLKILEISNTLLSWQWQEINEVQATGPESGEPDTLDTF